MGVRDGLKHKKRQDIAKIQRKHYHLQKINVQYMNIKKNSIGFNNDIKSIDLFFLYNIRADPMLGIGYVDVRQILCSRYGCLRKLDALCNIIQVRYNQYR